MARAHKAAPGNRSSHFLLLQTANTKISASEAKCSCGAKSALHCSCDKASIENEVTGARCSCRKSPSDLTTSISHSSNQKNQELALLEPAHAIVLPLKTLLQVAPFAPVVLDLLVGPRNYSKADIQSTN